MNECRICGNDRVYDYSDEIDLCPECLVICRECGEKPVTRYKLMRLAKHEKVIAEVPTRVCDDCKFEDAAWAILLGMPAQEGDDE